MDGPQTLFYRADLFKQYGITVSTTWVEFRDLWSGFWLGDDPKSPSQWVVGPY